MRGKAAGDVPGGLLTLRPDWPRVAPLPGEARLEGGKKNPTGRRLYKKQATKRRFWQISISLLFPAPAAMPLIPPALPPFRARGLVPVASGSLAAGKRRGGSIPILPRGNGAKFAVNLPLPFFTACGKGPCL